MEFKIEGLCNFRLMMCLQQKIHSSFTSARQIRIVLCFFHVVTLIKIGFSCEIKELSPPILLKTYLVESQIVVIMFFFSFAGSCENIYISNIHFQ